MSKLQNIKAVKEMIAGTHRTQTKNSVTFGDEKEFVKREVGDQWTDDDGNVWEQKKGYKVKLGKFSELRTELNTFPKCPKEVCTCTTLKRNDYKMQAIHGMCFDCVIDMEHQLRLMGKYKDYERNKVLENGKSWLQKAELEVEAVKAALKAKFVNEDGSIEEWGGRSWEEVQEKIENEFQLFRENFIQRLETEDEDIH